MNDRYFITLLLIVFFLMGVESQAQLAKDKNCMVEVSFMPQKGQTTKEVYRFQVKDKKECAQKAQDLKNKAPAPAATTKGVQYYFYESKTTEEIDPQ